MKNLQKYWASVKSFVFYNDHLTAAQPEEFGSRIIVEKNDGLTVHLYFADRSVIASNVGDEEYLINYDVRPNVSGYKFFDGRYVPHPNGDVKITGFFPNYQVAGLFIPVHIGPHLYFYPEPQEDIIYLAKTGQLRAPEVHVRRQCLTCQRDIPKSLGPRARFCSVECGLVTRDMAKRKRAASAVARQFTLPKIKPVRKCQKCGNPTPKSLGARSRFCSVECGLVTREVLATPSLFKCEACGSMFSRHGRQRFCSEECKPIKESKKHPCEHCGKPFTRYGRQRFCSEECKLRNKLDALR